MSSRRHPRSPAVPPMDDDDLLCEILLRLPPQPSSLPRASAVCKRWRRLVSEPDFFRRFRLRHRRNPPLLGFFDRDLVRPFLPALESPNRVPHGRFSLQSDDGGRLRSLGCRHGLVLIFVQERLQLLVWDPVTGHQRRLAVPPGFDATKTVISGAVLRAAGVHFQVVLIAPDDDEEIQQKRVVACVYSSETGVWGNLVSTPVPSEHHVVSMDPAVLVGDSLYWLLMGTSPNILEFDLERQSLAVIRMPVNISEDEANHGRRWDFTVTRTDGGGLGLLLVSRLTAQLWKRKTDRDGIASWVLGRTFELDKLLSLNSEDKGLVYILGFAEENNVVFLWTMIGVFMIHLESLKFKNLFKTLLFSYYHSFESVYAAGTCVGDEHDGAELLINM
ncbi:unnamed protein product [Alopecurus aequalis]